MCGVIRRKTGIVEQNARTAVGFLNVDLVAVTPGDRLVLQSVRAPVSRKISPISKRLGPGYCAAEREGNAAAEDLRVVPRPAVNVKHLVRPLG